MAPPLWAFHSYTSPPPPRTFNPPLPLRTFYCFTSPHGQFINSPPHPWILFITSPLPPPMVILFGEEHSVENLIIHSCDNGASRPCEHQLLGVLVSLPFAGVEFIWWAPWRGNSLSEPHDLQVDITQKKTFSVQSSVRLKRVQVGLISTDWFYKKWALHVEICIKRKKFAKY